MLRTHATAIDRFALLGAINPLDEKPLQDCARNHLRVSDAEISEFLVMRIEDAGPLIGAVVTESTCDPGTRPGANRSLRQPCTVHSAAGGYPWNERPIHSRTTVMQ